MAQPATGGIRFSSLTSKTDPSLSGRAYDAGTFPRGGAARKSRPRRTAMLAFNAFGTKEIVVYVIVVIVVLAIIGWYLMRGRSKA
jgi:hypothetical protein